MDDFEIGDLVLSKTGDTGREYLGHVSDIERTSLTIDDANYDGYFGRHECMKYEAKKLKFGFEGLEEFDIGIATTSIYELIRSLRNLKESLTDSLAARLDTFDIDALDSIDCIVAVEEGYKRLELIMSYLADCLNKAVIDQRE